jgi:HEAT repeat protein
MVIIREINNRQNNEATKWQALNALRHSGTKSAKVLTAIIVAIKITLATEHSEVAKGEALSCLAAMGTAGGTALPDVLRALHDDVRTVRMEAAYCLPLIAPASDKVIGSLIEALKDKDEQVQAAVCRGLGQFGKCAESAIIPLAAIATGKGWTGLRVTAAEALYMIDPSHQDIIPPLCKVLREGDWFEKRDVAAILRKMGPKAKAALPTLFAVSNDRQFGPIARDLIDEITGSKKAKPEK